MDFINGTSPYPLFQKFGSVFSKGAHESRMRKYPMKIDIKMIRYSINYELVAPILLIFNVILFTIMVSTGHPVVGSICSMLLSILGFLCVVES